MFKKTLHLTRLFTVLLLVSSLIAPTFAQDDTSVDADAETSASTEAESDDDNTAASGDAEANVSANTDTNSDGRTSDDSDADDPVDEADRRRIDLKLRQLSPLSVKDRKVRHQRNLYQLRWGEFAKRPACASVRADVITEALEAEVNVLPGCEGEKVEYEGSLAVSSGTLRVRKTLLFEENDGITQREGSEITFNSVINGHWDGLFVEYEPEKASGEPVNITIKLGELSETFSGADALGRHDIGNGHMLDLKRTHNPLASQSDRASERLLENKVKIQAKISGLQEALYRLRLFNKHLPEADELEELAEEVEAYNFDAESGAEVETELELALNDLDEEASGNLVDSKVERFRSRLQSIKDNARERKFREKMIPFKDTDDNEWYTGYVANVEARGIISGYKDSAGNPLGEYRPANNITVAELLKIGLETAEKGEAEGDPRLTAALNHWAKGYVKRAEELELDITADGSVDLNRPATRGEVVRLMLEALQAQADSVSNVDFSDVSASHRHAAYIQLAKALGIVSGDAGQNTFRPDAPVNRAEVAKIADLVIELLVGEE